MQKCTAVIFLARLVEYKAFFWYQFLEISETSTPIYVSISLHFLSQFRFDFW